MACLGLRSDGRNKVYHVMGLLCFMVLAQKGCAYEFKVGGSGDWSEDSKTGSYNTWAESKRFRVGDSLVFDYDGGDESVLQVTNKDYTNCNTASPIAKFTNGHTVFTFTQSGPYHFISGDKDHCLKNQKLVVVVMADRKGGSSSSPPPPPPPPSSATSLMVGSLGVFIASGLVLAF